MIAVALVSLANFAEAKPKRRDAKAAFDRGVAAYKKGSFAAASEALGKSFELERDVDTLFAWAQSERKLERCDKAIELYEKLLTFNLPPANKEAVDTKLTECRTQLQLGDRKVEPPPGTPGVEPGPASPPSGADPTMLAPASPRVTDSRAARAWYKDPIALTLVGTGVVAGGVGGGFLLSAKSLDSDFRSANDYQKAEEFSKDAKSREKIGLITAGVGGALVIGGVVWIVTHRHATEQQPITGWLAPGGGGLAVTGAF